MPWPAQDVNSLKDCLDVNLLLTAPNPKISVLQLCNSKRVGTVLPPTRWGKDAMVTESLFGEGCIIKVPASLPPLISLQQHGERGHIYVS